MRSKPIVKMGDPRLNQRCDEVEDFSDPVISEHINDMKITMKALDGIGIAAPQIGINKRIIMFGINLDDQENTRYL